MRQYLVFGIFLYISQRKQVRAKDIADKFEISLRTVYRYIDALSYVGIPIVCTQGRNGGISIMEDFKLDSLAFSEKDKELIKTALLKEKGENNDDVKKILKALE